jgi:two-component system chemotaxis response regulator CheB
MASSGPTGRDIIVIGASAGAVPALQRLAATLPPDLPAAIFIAVHLWPHAESFLPEILNRAGPLPAKHGAHGANIEPGKIYIAPVDRHLLLEDGKVFVTHGPRENRFRPAINPLFRSAAVAHRHRVIGVILTGMLDDGAAGLWAVKQCGGIAVVQSDAQFDEMPRYALQNVEVDHHVPLAEIGPLLVRLCHEPVEESDPDSVPEIIRLNDEKTKMKTNEIDLDRVGRRSIFSCPECNGALWEVKEGSQVMFSCHVGHSYTARGLDEAQSISIEQSLWSAVRALKENAEMHERLAVRAREQGLTDAARLYQRTASQRTAEAVQVQALLNTTRAVPTASDGNGKSAASA